MFQISIIELFIYGVLIFLIWRAFSAFSQMLIDNTIPTDKLKEEVESEPNDKPSQTEIVFQEMINDIDSQIIGILDDYGDRIDRYQFKQAVQYESYETGVLLSWEIVHKQKLLSLHVQLSLQPSSSNPYYLKVVNSSNQGTSVHEIPFNYASDKTLNALRAYILSLSKH